MPSLDLSPLNIASFFARIQVPIDDIINGCWIWRGPLSPKGYGKFVVGKQHWRTHRLMLVLNGEELIDGLEVDHLCRNRACLNPRHLRQVTKKQNMHAKGSMTFQARNASKTVCPLGHAYTPDNTYTKPSGQRVCITCRNEQKRQARARRKLRSRGVI